ETSSEVFSYSTRRMDHKGIAGIVPNLEIRLTIEVYVSRRPSAQLAIHDPQGGPDIEHHASAITEGNVRTLSVPRRDLARPKRDVSMVWSASIVPPEFPNPGGHNYQGDDG